MADNHERLDQFKKPDKGTEFSIDYKVPSFNVAIIVKLNTMTCSCPHYSCIVKLIYLY